MPIVLKSGSLKLLEPSGPVQVCNGIALPFTYDCKILYFSCHHTCDLCLVRDAEVKLNLQHIFQREMPYTEHSHPGRDIEKIGLVRELLLSCSQEELKIGSVCELLLSCSQEELKIGSVRELLLSCSQEELKIGSVLELLLSCSQEELKIGSVRELLLSCSQEELKISSVRELLLSCPQEELKNHLNSLIAATFLTAINSYILSNKATSVFPKNKNNSYTKRPWHWNLLDRDKRISLFRIVTKIYRTIQNRFSLCLQ